MMINERLSVCTSSCGDSLTDSERHTHKTGCRYAISVSTASIGSTDEARVEEIRKRRDEAARVTKERGWMNAMSPSWSDIDYLLSRLKDGGAEKSCAKFSVQWCRPNEAEVLECHGLTADSLALRIRAAIRSYGRVELLSLTPTAPAESSERRGQAHAARQLADAFTAAGEPDRQEGRETNLLTLLILRSKVPTHDESDSGLPTSV